MDNEQLIMDKAVYSGNGVPVDKPSMKCSENLPKQQGSTPCHRSNRVQNKSLDGSGYGTSGGFDSRRRTKTYNGMKATDETMKERRQRIHILCARLGMSDDDRRAMLLANYGVESTFAMDAWQMDELIRALDTKLCDSRGVVSMANEMDKLRKRLMGIIGRWLRAVGYSESAEMIKAVACRASGKKSFNAIPADRLRSLYGAFSKRLKDLETAETIEAEAKSMPAVKGNGMLN